MSHKTLVGGTVYNITGGKSMVSGTTYSIKGGKTLVNGTGYNISFGPTGEPTAMLYSDGNMVFQLGDAVESGKTLTASYTGFEDASYTYPSDVPWNAQKANIASVYCCNEISPVSMCQWFSNCINLVNVNYAYFNVSNVINMAYTYRNCYNLTGSPVCGESVQNFCSTYENCYNLTGSPVCGESVVKMIDAFSNCCNLTGSPVFGNNVRSIVGAYRGCVKLTGPVVCRNTISAIDNAFANCPNIFGNAYFYSIGIATARKCFVGKNNSRRLNLYIPANSSTNTAVHYNNKWSLVGANITWTTNDTCSYNTRYNIYIYPVENVAAAYELNEQNIWHSGGST